MSAAWEGPDEVRAMRQFQRVYDCGPRACYEMLRELTADPVARQDIDCLLERYARITPKMIDSLDGRRLRTPIFVVDDDTVLSNQTMRGAA